MKFMTGNFEIGDGGGGAKVDLKIESYLVFFFCVDASSLQVCWRECRIPRP
jgi:hypothetical protein